MLIAALETLGIWVTIALIYGPPEPVVCLATISALLFAVPVNLTLGNLVSLYFPCAAISASIAARLFRDRALVSLGSSSY